MKFKFEFLACLCQYTHSEWECWRQLGLGGGQTSGVFFFPLPTGPQDFAWGWG